MSTTDLFVEIIVIGVGAMIWLGLMVMSVFGYSWLPSGQLFSLASLLPILAITYVLGIIVDRASDALFDKLWKPSLAGQFYPKDGDDYDDRRYIYLRSEQLAKLLEYGRSRLRICRGWTLNSLLIWLSLNLFILRQLSDAAIKIPALCFGNLFLALFSYGCWFSWKQLTLADYRKVKRQSAWLKTQK